MSLMQQFAQARQQRLDLQRQRKDDTENLLAQAQRDRQHLASQIQAEAQTQLQERQSGEQARRHLAHQEQQQRQAQNQARHQAIQNFLEQTTTERLDQAHRDAQNRHQDLSDRRNQVKALRQNFQAEQQATAQTLRQEFQALQQHLAALNTQRLIQSDRRAQERLGEMQARVALVERELTNLSQARITQTQRDRSERQAFRQASIQAVQELMGQVRQDYQALQQYIWGNTPGIQAPPTQSQTQTEPQEPVEQLSPQPPEVEKFIISYVSQLDQPMPLAQLVSDRELVKGLLASGANTLKVEPSEVLNVLLKMVEAL
ncbi:MAG: hypothetical protein SFT94_05515 [Pseudanabaenaceae cyanobacterium bins.68]|nr:hypothetical protein [Pseudanabaenaceae cyanobacterium bins.68]